MNSVVTKELIDEILEQCELQSLASVWSFSEFPNQTFSERTEVFFLILQKVLESGVFKLKKDGEYLTGTSEEQVQLFRDTFPATDHPYPDLPDCDASYWFFDDKCPGQAVWKAEHPDGTIEWMHCP
jgi:hypothetical protein